jgi:signal transduction histidine kinase
VKPLLPFFKTADNRLSSAYYASDNALWVGLYKGTLYKMAENGTVEIIKSPEKFSTRSFTEDAEHHIWVGTINGLHVYTLQGKLLKSFYKNSGLLNDCIYSLLPIPGKSSVIAGSNMGLSVISLNGNIKNYTKEIGLQDNEFNTAAAVKTAAGKYYFGGINGITAFNLSALEQSQNKPQLNMIKLVVNDSSYNSSGIYRGDTIQLKYNQNHLQFDFAAMGALNADKYFYKYRLVGFEKQWKSTHRPTDIGYILQPGNYTLEIDCSSELSGTGVKKSILIIIDPPWWLTWWFLFIICLCSVGLIILLVSLYNRRKYQKTLHELLLKQGLQTQRERISRDLHDNLGAQANAIYYGTELLKQKNDYEQKLVDNLHDTAGDMLTVLRETLWAMKITQVDAADLWLRVLNFARKIGTYYPGVKINIHGAPPGNLTINATLALNIILILQEGLNNAIRHAEATELSINGYSTEKFWKIEIVDNGKGFDPFAANKRTENYGLENMAERANESDIAFEINSILCLGTKISLEIDLTKSNIN